MSFGRFPSSSLVSSAGLRPMRLSSPGLSIVRPARVYSSDALNKKLRETALKSKMPEETELMATNYKSFK
ncbi:hypothetical protein H4R33_004974, partial [Dimargaris cristalligena]